MKIIHHFLVDEYEGTITPGRWTGDERVAISVQEIRPGTWRLDCDVYYDSAAVFSMEITQPLERALLTFAAALVVDSHLAGSARHLTEMRRVVGFRIVPVEKAA